MTNSRRYYSPLKLDHELCFVRSAARYQRVYDRWGDQMERGGALRALRVPSPADHLFLPDRT